MTEKEKLAWLTKPQYIEKSIYCLNRFLLMLNNLNDCLGYDEHIAVIGFDLTDNIFCQVKTRTCTFDYNIHFMDVYRVLEEENFLGMTELTSDILADIWEIEKENKAEMHENLMERIKKACENQTFTKEWFLWKTVLAYIFA